MSSYGNGSERICQMFNTFWTFGMLRRVLFISSSLFSLSEVVPVVKYPIYLLLFPGLRKKLVALSKEKDCTDLKEWIDSIINHLYWSVMSTDSAEPNLVEAKWTSVLNHIVNIHTHNNELFPKCEHKRLRGRAARKKWLKPCKYVLYILHSRIFFFIGVICRSISKFG